jgi:hypothetical protein
MLTVSLLRVIFIINIIHNVNLSLVLHTGATSVILKQLLWLVVIFVGFISFLALLPVDEYF